MKHTILALTVLTAFVRPAAAQSAGERHYLYVAEPGIRNYVFYKIKSAIIRQPEQKDRGYVADIEY